jgi:NADH-quinone oxidoreductase subunit L
VEIDSVFDRIVILIIAFPLLAVLANGLNVMLGRRYSDEIVHRIGWGSVLLSFVCSLWVVTQVLYDPTPRNVILYPWIFGGDLQINLGFLIDPLTCVMLLVVTGVGLLIHVYSVGYMHGEEGFARFFTYMNLFMVSMLVLVMGNNYVVLFIGWEGVGLCSYLLIGYYYDRVSAAQAATKAFVVNRIGDAGFLIAIFLVFANFKTLDYTEVFAQASKLDSTTAAAIAICLLIGAVGKSAQLPLYTWLPDAMEGPTPVSALIHAATMVTAGVYMVVRNHAIYDLAPAALLLVGIIGGATALFAATIALVQTDIKRVLAYSTVSQLGFMFLACGVGAYTAAIFHLVTHAFFKALLFLSAGSVIHALAGEQDIRKMGGLWKVIPTTHWVFLIGVAAIAGFPFLSGWWSKDEILGHAFTHGYYVLWLLGAVAAFCTAFYMSRLLYLIFYGPSRVNEHAAHHIHESPPVMLMPLVILAVLSVVGGLIGVIPGGLENGWFHQFLRPVVSLAAAGEAHEGGLLPFVLMTVTTVIALAGWFTAHYFYQLNPGAPDRLRDKTAAAYTILLNKYWVDEIYDKAFVQSSKKVGRELDAVDTGVLDGAVTGVWRLTEMGAAASTWFEKYIIYGGINVVGYSNHIAAQILRKLQSGLVHHYASILVAGFVILVNLIVLFLWVRGGL